MFTNATSQLSDNFKDFATTNAGNKCPSNAFFAHCHQELFHEQWKVLLDDEFVNAYEHGIIITCCNGIKWHFYPQIFTYSADYPEKWVMGFFADFALAQETANLIHQNSDGLHM